MKQPVEYYISELLFLHDCVIVPEFGGFVGNEVPAKLNKITGTLYPPSKSVPFNRNLTTNDGLLATHIAKQENIETNSANNKLADFVEKLNSDLKKTKSVRLDGIGLFTTGKEGNIMFLQDRNVNFSIDAYGLKKIQSRKTERIISISNRKDSQYKTKTSNPPNLTKTILKGAAILLPLIGLSIISISGEQQVKNIYAQFAKINPLTYLSFDVEDNHTLISKSDIKNEIEKPSHYDASEIKKTVTHSENKINYYIIAGVFKEQRNIKKMLLTLEKDNYKPSILETNNKLVRVYYDRYESKEEALIALAEIRKSNATAWLLSQ